MVDAFQRLVEQATRSYFIDDPVHRRAVAVEALGKNIHRDAPAIGAENRLFRVCIQSSAKPREESLIGVLPIKILDRVAHSLDGAPETATDPATNGCQGAPSQPGHSPGPCQNLILLFFRELRKSAASVHAVMVRLQKRID